MTMPTERTRALRWVGEFLRECRERELPEDLALQIDAILEDYPSNQSIAYAADDSSKASCSPWMLPED